MDDATLGGTGEHPRFPSAAEGEITASGKFVPYRAAAAPERDETLIAETSPGHFLIGRVTVDRDARTVTVPAVVNQRQHQVEYLLVSESGKRHESVLRTAARPEHVHAACLLLGLRSQPFPPVDAEATQALTVDIVWPKHGPPAHLAPEQVFVTAPTEQSASAHPPGTRWIYNGSETGTAGFAAQLEGSFIALIPDGSALVNGLGLPPGDYLADEDSLPAVGTPVLVVLRFPPVSAGVDHLPGTAP